MVRLKSEYFIDEIIPSTESRTNLKKACLWVWHADKIPPHIGISVDRRYFSLKANGKDELLDIDHVVELIEKKKIPSLCFELDNPIELYQLEEVFGVYETTIPVKRTCLQPVKEVLELPRVRKLTELLTELYIRQNILRVIGYNLPGDFEGIKNYSTKDIHDRLKLLRNA